MGQNVYTVQEINVIFSKSEMLDVDTNGRKLIIRRPISAE